MALGEQNTGGDCQSTSVYHRQDWYGLVGWYNLFLHFFRALRAEEYGEGCGTREFNTELQGDAVLSVCQIVP